VKVLENSDETGWKGERTSTNDHTMASQSEQDKSPPRWGVDSLLLEEYGCTLSHRKTMLGKTNEESGARETKEKTLMGEGEEKAKLTFKNPPSSAANGPPAQRRKGAPKKLEESSGQRQRGDRLGGCCQRSYQVSRDKKRNNSKMKATTARCGSSRMVDDDRSKWVKTQFKKSGVEGE